MSARDQYNEGTDQPFHPAKQFAAVTPHASTNFASLPIGIYVGVGGSVVCVNRDESTVTFVNVPAGTLLPIRPIRINATGTTASSMVALF